jgi:uracil-DNA glycosylase
LNDPHAVPIRSLAAVRREGAKCRRCGLYRGATQVVPGEGKVGAGLMLVGEQPGDSEDVAGKPFVGAAGRVLDRALMEADVPRGKVFVTNAVKHFKYEFRGKRRPHKRPNAGEIEACRWFGDRHFRAGDRGDDWRPPDRLFQVFPLISRCLLACGTHSIVTVWSE